MPPRGEWGVGSNEESSKKPARGPLARLLMLASKYASLTRLSAPGVEYWHEGRHVQRHSPRLARRGGVGVIEAGDIRHWIAGNHAKEQGRGEDEHGQNAGSGDHGPA